VTFNECFAVTVTIATKAATIKTYWWEWSYRETPTAVLYSVRVINASDTVQYSTESFSRLKWLSSELDLCGNVFRSKALVERDGDRWLQSEQMLWDCSTPLKWLLELLRHRSCLTCHSRPPVRIHSPTSIHILSYQSSVVVDIVVSRVRVARKPMWKTRLVDK